MIDLEVHAARPLVVDLDGSLIKTDLLAETASRFLVGRPGGAFKLLAWLREGRVVLKSRLAEATTIDVALLPYNEELLAWLRLERSQGRRIVLATASHRLLAEQVARHLGCFDAVLASDADRNLKGSAKRDALVQLYGERGFDYVGNDWPDLKIWQSAAQAHVVGRSPRLTERVRQLGNLGRIIDHGGPSLPVAFGRALRPHQWLKNLLIFIPLLAAHLVGDGTRVLHAVLAFVIFGLTASSAYLLNDLVDVADDRRHARKRRRPFAAGHLSLVHGWAAWPLLLMLSFSTAAWLLPWRFIVCLSIYFVLTIAYSLRLKRIPVLDVFVLAGLYTLRIVTGAAAVDVPLSFWLLLFSIFLFLSLALVKRFSELKTSRDAGVTEALPGRGYAPQDLEMVSSLGGSAGYIAVLVLGLYVQDSHTATLYAEPRFIWLACPVLLYWISRVWLIAHRGKMHDDPIVFAVTDRVSWAVILILVLAFVLAKVVT